MEVKCIGEPKIVDPEYFWNSHKMDIYDFYRDPNNIKAFKEWQKNKNFDLNEEIEING